MTINSRIKVGALIAAATALTMPALTDAATSNSDVSVAVNAVISVSSSGTVTLGALTPDSTGKQSIASDTVTTSTNDTAGYTLTLKDADTTYTLASGSDTFAASSGTPAAPATLSNGEWGWRVDSLGSFGAGPTSSASNASPSSVTFAGIPANASPYTIKTTSANGTTSATVWYSARANDAQPIGTYTDTVTYTATAN